MPIRVAGVVEKNIQTDDSYNTPVVLAAGTAQDVLKDILNGAPPNNEVVSRYVQNIGANLAYYAIGVDCGGLIGPCHGRLDPGQQLNVSDSGQRVSILSPAGTTVATTVFLRLAFPAFNSRSHDPAMKGK